MGKLVIKNLHVSVSDRELISGIDLTLQSGQLIVLMGPNGAGKSSLAKVLAGHPDYQVTQGEVTLNKVDLLKLIPDKRSQAGLFLAFQQPVEVPGVKATQFLWEAYRAKTDNQISSTKKITSIFDFREYLLQLAEELQLNPKFLSKGLNENLSGGEKKKLEILQMLALKPRFAILDEIDSGLDFDAVKIIAKSIQRALTELKLGVLLITHDRRILKYLKPSLVMVMKKGKIVKRGDESLLANVEVVGYQSL